MKCECCGGEIKREYGKVCRKCELTIKHKWKKAEGEKNDR